MSQSELKKVCQRIQADPRYNLEEILASFVNSG